MTSPQFPAAGDAPTWGPSGQPAAGSLHPLGRIIFTALVWLLSDPGFGA